MLIKYPCNETPIYYRSYFLTEFRSDRCDLRDGLNIVVSNSANEEQLQKDYLEFGSFFMNVIHPNLNGFRGWPGIKIKMQRTPDNTEKKIDRAIRLATQYHQGQYRKNSGLPYIVHPIAVMDLVRKSTDDEDVLAAAVLHDMIEDTSFSPDQMEMYFGTRVLELVTMVSKVSSPEDGSRKVRKELDLEHYKKGDKWGQTIKFCDRFHNLTTISWEDPKYVRTYLQESKNLLINLNLADNLSARRLSEQIESMNNRLYYIEKAHK